MAASYPILQTFRDPSGSVDIRRDAAYRFVREPFASEFLEFLQTPVADKFVLSKELIESEVLSRNSEELHLRHPLVPFISYPWEWPVGMWQQAAELTLQMCAELLEHGWQLKDATPLNILFRGPRPVLVDVLSIEKAKAGESLWQPYGQFIRTFLLPLLAHSSLGWPLKATQIRRDGFEPEEIFAALSLVQKVRRPALSAVSLPVLLSALSRRRSGSQLTTRSEHLAAKSAMAPEIATRVLLRRLRGLRIAVRKALPRSRESAWKHYVDTATHYSTEEHTQKKEFVAKVLAAAATNDVLDIGCNTGAYSRLAADQGARVVSIDSDMQALERLYHDAKNANLDILPLCVDIAYPTPAFGWDNRETLSFLTRCEGKFDVVMMLAVIHHLLLSSQIPLPHIASLCSRLTKRTLILEWVPSSDPKYIEVLRGRSEIYCHITESAMRKAFSEHFTVAAEMTLANGRILLQLDKKAVA